MRAAAVAMVISAACAGCEGWTGFGFHEDGREMPRIREALALGTGAVVADIGAGKGELTFALAKVVGPGGRVYSTDIDPERVRSLRENAPGNVTVLEGTGGETGLPPGCCDAIVLRRVYHHLGDPIALGASLLRSLRPGGVLAVIDFPPPFFLGRGDFGVPLTDVTAEVTKSGFQVLRVMEDWPGRGPLGSYCVVFRKP